MHTHGRLVALVLVLSALLLGGRFALATHPYDHDVTSPAPECELCEFGHILGDAAPGADRGLADAPCSDHLDGGSPFSLPPATWSIYQPRAPPFLV